MNDTGWAGNLASGWHALPKEATDFIYLRCFGAKSRSLGSYDAEFLKEMVATLRRAESAVIMFGQGDAPQQALGNAWELNDLCRLSTEELQALPAKPSSRSTAGKLVSGVVLRRGKDRAVLVNVEGRVGYLGSRHSRRRGLDFRPGEVLKNLRVESEENGRLVLSVCEEDSAPKAVG